MQLADVCIAQKRYEEAQKLNDDAYAILFPLFGENDSDTLHAMTRKVKILFGMERYEEALALSDKAVGIYAQFYKEVHSSRYDHLLLRLQCLMYLNRKAEAQELAAYLLNLARKIFAPGAKQLQDLQGLVDKI